MCASQGQVDPILHERFGVMTMVLDVLRNLTINVELW
jgi:hypothetical protein